MLLLLQKHNVYDPLCIYTSIIKFLPVKFAGSLRQHIWRSLGKVSLHKCNRLFSVSPLSFVIFNVICSCSVRSILLQNNAKKLNKKCKIPLFTLFHSLHSFLYSTLEIFPRSSKYWEVPDLFYIVRKLQNSTHSYIFHIM